MMIVVGVDGSAEARNALRWAAREARLHGAELWVVNAWSFPFAARGPVAQPVLEAEVIEEVRRAAVALVEHELDDVHDDVGGLEVGRVVVEGAPTDVLLDVSERADMLVLGIRAGGGSEPPDPVSVAHQCIHRARCPVVAVPS